MFYTNSYPAPRPPQYPTIDWNLYPQPYNRQNLGHVPQVKEAVTFIKTMGHPPTYVDIRTTAGYPLGQYPAYDPYWASSGRSDAPIPPTPQQTPTPPAPPYIPPALPPAQQQAYAKKEEESSSFGWALFTTLAVVAAFGVGKAL